MNKTYWLLLVIVLGIFVGTVYWLAMRQNVVVEPCSYNMDVVSIQQKDNFYNIQVEYPQFKDASDDFNNKISELINNEIDTFKKDAQDAWQARKDTAPSGETVPEYPEQPFDFIASWQPSQVNDDYISFVISLYYCAGGAHGINETDTFNYDVVKQQEITMLDFLNSSQENLNKLADLAKQDITIQLENSGVQLNDSLNQMIDMGTEANLDNYQNFTFNFNSLTVYFQQYQVAPGAVGSLKSVFYKSTLDSKGISSDYLH